MNYVIKDNFHKTENFQGQKIIIYIQISISLIRTKYSIDISYYYIRRNIHIHIFFFSNTSKLIRFIYKIFLV